MGTSGETRLHLVDGLHFVGTTPSGHAIHLDSKAEGAPSAATPMELQLIALGGCTAMDTLSVLRKMRQEVSAYDVRLTSERAAEHPRVYTSIVMTHEIGGRDLSEAQIRRAIQLTMIRYCPVFAMLYPKVEIRERYEIKDSVSGGVLAGDVSTEGRDTEPV
jgi:putative redox protein